MYSAVSGEMATLSETYRSTFHTLKSVIYNQLRHLFPSQPFSLLSSINHSLSDHKSAIYAVEQPSRHLTIINLTRLQRLPETWSKHGKMQLTLHADLCSLTSELYRLDPPGVKIAVFPLGQFFRLKGKTCSYTICRDWLSKFVSTEALSVTVARWAFTLWNECGKVLHRAFPPFFAWLHVFAYSWAGTWHFSFKVFFL